MRGRGCGSPSSGKLAGLLGRLKPHGARLTPHGLAPELTRKLNAEINRIMALPDVKERMEAIGVEAVNETPEQFAATLRTNGIEPKAAEIGYYSIQPMYDWKNPKRKLVGYQVTTNVSLKLKDFSKIGPITQQLADAAVSESQSVSYTLDNMDEAKTKAVEDAYRRARASADALARAAGRAATPWCPGPTSTVTPGSSGRTPPPWSWRTRRRISDRATRSGSR